MEEAKRITGKIIKLSDDGWGFISSRELKFTRIFFHWTALSKSCPRFDLLNKGMSVTFIPIKYEDKGFRAIKIELIANTPQAEEKAIESI